MFGDVVAAVDNERDARARIERLLSDDALWRERSAAGIRRVHGQHTYAHRLARIAELAGYRISAYGDERIAVLMLVDHPSSAALDRIIAQSERPHEVVIGATAAAEVDGATVIQQAAGRPRAERLAELARATDVPWVLIADAAHSYRLDHLADLAVARRWTHADIIGVEAHDRASVHAHPAVHRYVRRVEPHGALVRRELVAEHGWDDRDADRAQGPLEALGATLYSVGQ
jgi:hypothetical protein